MSSLGTRLTSTGKAAVGRLFVLDVSGGRILSMGLDGSDRTVIVTECRHPDGIVVDEVQAGQRGELVARGANVMRGYWNDPEDTAAAFRNGFFRIEDIGYRDADGYFYILDRLKDMIVTGGENVYSGEVEAVILGHPAVVRWRSSAYPIRSGENSWPRPWC